MKKSTFTRAAVGLLLMAVGSGQAAARPETDMGTIYFPNSGAPEAQEHFIRGVLALHNFWFEEAEEAFQKAQSVDPDFALAYWGEAMSYNHPLWSEQDMAAARKALQRLGKTRAERFAKAQTEREKAYLGAIETLYGQGDKLTRDKAYSKAMRRLSERFFDDDEAKVFYALSLLGTVRRGDQGFFRQVKSGALLAEIYKRHPDHPGVVHFIIHSYDDPEHAPLALEAAEVYAQVAPESPHALHMPSHIFIQHGMWDRVVLSNKEAYAASEKWVERKNLSLAKKDFHSLEWGQYGNLQRGQYEKARTKTEITRDVAEKTQDSRTVSYTGTMQARVIVESRQWEDMALPEVSTTKGTESSARAFRYRSTPNVLLAAGMSAAYTGNLSKAEEAASRLKILRDGNQEQGRDYQSRDLDVMYKELSAIVLFEQGKKEDALKLAGEAAAQEETMDPPSGPPHPLKPSHELYGELLLAAGQYDEAKKQFEIALLRMPDRSLSLLGLGRAATHLGDVETATEAFTALQRNWANSDANNPDLAAVGGYKTSEDQ